MGANAQTSVPSFTAGEVLTAANMNISARTGIPVFADTTARDAAFGGTGEKTLAEGQFAYLEDTNATQYYDGSAWQAVATTNITNDTATVATQQTTTSVTYTDLATSGPAVTVTTGTKVLVIISAGEMRNQNSSGECDMSFAVSGATTIAAADATSVGITSAASNETFRPTGAFVITVTAGSNTFTAKYRVGGGTGIFANRRISVINLGS
jgi:hypothetical protein